MKAIFAVSALAAAISAQAMAADTEITTSVHGAVKFVTEIDLEGSVNADGDDVSEIDVYLDEEDDADDGGNFGAYIDWDIVNGPFSANIEIAGEDGDATLSINDVMVSEGAFSFGQLGELNDTYEYTHLMGDLDNDYFAAVGANAEGAPVDAAFRYTMGGLAVQLEGVQGPTGDGATGNSQFGIGSQYMGEADALSYVVEAQVRASSLTPDGASPYYFAGAGVTYAADMFSVAAAVNTFSWSTDATVGDNINDESVLKFGAEVIVMPTEDSSVYGKGTMVSNSLDGVDPSSEYVVGATYQIDAIGLTAEYYLIDAGAPLGAIDNGSDFFHGQVDYTAGAYDYYVSVEVYFDEGDGADPFFEAGVSTTTESGITYAADFDFQADLETELKLTAAYSF